MVTWGGLPTRGGEGPGGPQTGPTGPKRAGGVGGGGQISGLPTNFFSRGGAAGTGVFSWGGVGGPPGGTVYVSESGFFSGARVSGQRERGRLAIWITQNNKPCPRNFADRRPIRRAKGGGQKFFFGLSPDKTGKPWPGGLGWCVLTLICATPGMGGHFPAFQETKTKKKPPWARGGGGETPGGHPGEPPRGGPGGGGERFFGGASIGLLG